MWRSGTEAVKPRPPKTIMSVELVASVPQDISQRPQRHVCLPASI